jgi:hypothetical protein
VTRWAAAIALLAALLAADPCRAAQRVVEYSIAARGDVGQDLDAFVAAAAAAYADPRGWSLDGAVEFRRVKSGGDFVLWLASSDEMTSFSSGCSPLWSCRAGRDVVVNDLRFHDGSPYWSGALDDYRTLLINHETGHWIGFDHSTCQGSGDEAPVMMQQSKGVGDCVGNPWPLAGERLEAARMMRIAALSGPESFDPPKTRGFEAVP